MCQEYVIALGESVGWTVVFAEWLSERRAIKKDVYERRRVLFLENCSGHIDTDRTGAQLAEINTELWKLPPRSTDTVQPADSFMIYKIKDTCRKRWDAYKVGMMTPRDYILDG